MQDKIISHVERYALPTLRGVPFFGNGEDLMP